MDFTLSSEQTQLVKMLDEARQQRVCRKSFALGPEP